MMIMLKEKKVNKSNKMKQSEKVGKCAGKNSIAVGKCTQI